MHRLNGFFLVVTFGNDLNFCAAAAVQSKQSQNRSCFHRIPSIFLTKICAEKVSASLTNFADARACSPFLLEIVISQLATISPTFFIRLALKASAFQRCRRRIDIFSTRFHHRLHRFIQIVATAQGSSFDQHG